MVNIKAFPFCLNETQADWVENTWNAMTNDEKIGQLFCPIVFSSDPEELTSFVTKKHVGGILYREGKAQEIQQNHRILQDASKIPLLIASNLEAGGVGSAVEGTYYGREMLVAAAGNKENAYELGKIACSEGAAVGVNWSFAPVVDIDNNFRNPIINVRSFGNNPEVVIEMAKEYCRGAKEAGLAVAVKHFPGDGMDERDQHLLTSVNTCSYVEWLNTYGMIYQSLISEGVLSVMAGHIAFPAYEEKCTGKKSEAVIPATLSKNLLQNLLRKELGFNGLICTDATPMAGFCSAMDRRHAVPLSIENGCDMFLFNRDLDEDMRYMKEGYEAGLLSEDRLHDAVLRILAMKAALHLPEKQQTKTLVPEQDALSIINCEAFNEAAKVCAEEGVTLVKDTQKLLPLDVQKQKRVLLELLGDYPSNERVQQQFVQELTQQGFAVTVYQKEDMAHPLDTVEQFKSKYDLVIYVANIETASNRTTARINWYTLFGLGNNIPWFVHEIPTLFISVGNPYHLIDVPMVQTYINGYCNSSYVINAVVQKITGKSTFVGKSPCDPFCGREDTRY